MQAKRVVVVGAGVVGLCAAWRLGEAGAEVTLVEAERPGSGTSGTSFAWVNASSKADAAAPYFALNAMGLAEHRTLAVCPGEAPWFMPTGEIDVAADVDAAAALARKVERLRGLGYAAELLTGAQLEELEPGTRLPPGAGAAFYAQEGWVGVSRMIAAVLGRLRGAGGTVVESDPAQEIVRTGGMARGVRLASGASLEADAVVVAVGRWTEAFARRFGVAIPLVAPEPAGSAALGLLARIRPQSAVPRRLLHSDAINWSPLFDGRALLASDAGDAAVAGDRSPETAAREAAALVGRAAALNPLFAGATVETATVGIRALPRDRVTVCGPAPGIGGLHVVVTHSGVTLAPLLGRLLAEEIVDGREAAALASFRPDRFLDRSA